MSATLPVVIGSVIGYWYDRRVERRPNVEHAKRLGVLVASGMIVGESLLGVIVAGLIVAKVPLGLVPDDFAPANWIGLAAFVALIVLLYGWMLRRAKAG
jgi:hypothetical protein